MCTPEPGTFDFSFHLVRAARDIAAKNEARAKAIAAAPTELKKSITRFAHAVQDYDAAIRLEHSDPPFLHVVDPRPLAEATMDLARTVKALFPTHRVPELIRLDRALRDYHNDPGPADQLPARLLWCIEEAIGLGQDLHLIQDDLSLGSARARLDHLESRPSSEAATPMPSVRIFVVGADGQRRGSFFRDSPDHEHRWDGPTRPSLHESMVCHPNLEEGSYYLIEYVLPRQIEGSELRDDQVDQASTCRQVTLPQALLWFSNQVFGAPPSLITRTQNYAEVFDKIDSSVKARDLAQAIRNRRFVSADHAIFTGRKSELDLLLAARFVYGQESQGKTTYDADPILITMGIEDYLAWVRQQIARIQPLLRTTDRMTPPAWSPSTHQEIVLSFLRKNGRTQTGVLWKRLFPKHIDRRAHQNQMAELVEQKVVETAGKGRGIHYWVP